MFKRYQKTILLLLFFTALSLFMTLFRVYWTDELTYIFLAWNLFLAWVPFVTSLFIDSIHRRVKKINLVIIALSLIWLLFYPNAPYIVTDLLHLKVRNAIPLWFDLMLILSYAWAGLLIGFVSLYLLQNIVKTHLGKVAGWLFVLISIGLGSIGVFLGRFLRWNSWDFFYNPRQITSSVVTRITNPLSHKSTLLFTLVFSTFSFFSYLALYFFNNLHSEWEAK